MITIALLPQANAAHTTDAVARDRRAVLISVPLKATVISPPTAVC